MQHDADDVSSGPTGPGAASSSVQASSHAARAADALWEATARSPPAEPFDIEQGPPVTAPPAPAPAPPPLGKRGAGRLPEWAPWAADAASALLVAASLALDTALCVQLFHHGGRELLWAALGLMAALLAPFLVTGVAVVQRNAWLEVALRYCTSLVAIQRQEGVMCFAPLRPAALRCALRSLALLVVLAVGSLVTAYLSLCYLVTAVLSVPVLDAALLVSLSPARRHFLDTDMVFLESYKAARCAAHAALQSAPAAALCTALLIGAPGGGPEPGLAAACLALALANLLQKGAQLGVELRLVDCTLPRHLCRLWHLQGGVRLPPPIAQRALAAMHCADSGRLHIIAAWCAADVERDTLRRPLLPLVPRYLFPPDAGWLAPGQMAVLSREAFARHPSSGVHTWVVEQMAGELGGQLVCGLGNLPHLRSLTLQWCRLTRRSLQGALPLLAAHPQLRQLRIQQCDVTRGAAQLLGRLLAQSSPLAQLHIVRCRMAAPTRCAQLVAEGLAANTSLLHLNYASNAAGRDGGLAFARALRANTRLRHLNLSFNRLCASGGAALAAAAGAHPRLERLVLQRKEVGAVGLRALVDMLVARTGHQGPLTLSKHPSVRNALRVEGLPLEMVCAESLASLASERWLQTPPQQAPGGDAEPLGAQAPQTGAPTLPAGAPSGELSVIGEEGSVVEGALSVGMLSHGGDDPTGGHEPAAAGAAAVVGAVPALHGRDCNPSGARDQDARRGGAQGDARAPSGSKTLSAAEPLSPAASEGDGGGGGGGGGGDGGGGGGGGGARAALPPVRCPLVVLVSLNPVAESIVAAASSLAGLAHLDCSGLPLGDQGCCAFALALPSLPGLRSLSLAATGLYRDGPFALAAAAPHCPGLTHLDLGANTVCDEAALGLAAALEGGAWPALQLLRLADNRYPFTPAVLLALHRLPSRRRGLAVELQLGECGAAAAPSGAGQPATPPGASGRRSAPPPSPGRGGGSPRGAAAASAPASPPRPRHRRSSSGASSEADLCGVCFDRTNHVAVRMCGHRLCVECYRELCKPRADTSSTSDMGAPAVAPVCPFCRGAIAGFWYTSNALQEIAAAAGPRPSV